jgi:uncharacterized protein YgbK (DUF1537 family)
VISHIDFAVLADDLVGASFCAARLYERGLRPVVIWEREEGFEHADVVVVDMQTRAREAVTHPDASERAGDWVEWLLDEGCRNFELRVDSLLRGSPSHELRGIHRRLGIDNYLVVAVVAFPDAGRYTLSGVQHCVTQASDQEHEKDVGAHLFPGQDHAVVQMATVQQGWSAILGELIANAQAGGTRFVVDASSNEDLAQIAMAVDRLTAVKPVLTVSSGGWLHRHPVALTPRRGFIVVAATATRTNEVQVTQLLATGQAALLRPHEALNLAHRSQSLRETLIETPTLIVADFNGGPQPGSDPEQVAAAAASLLSAAEAEHSKCDGVVVSGGEVADALARTLEAKHLESEGEVGPLCSISRIEGGPWTGLRLAVKGDGAGSPHGLRNMVAALR